MVSGDRKCHMLLVYVYRVESRYVSKSGRGKKEEREGW